jgi:hypothetical protein
VYQPVVVQFSERVLYRYRIAQFEHKLADRPGSLLIWPVKRS